MIPRIGYTNRMRIPAVFSLLCIAALTTASGGCVELECGTGTHREGAYCLPNIPSTCGEGTVYERGWCVLEDVGTEDAYDGSAASDTMATARDGGR